MTARRLQTGILFWYLQAERSLKLSMAHFVPSQMLHTMCLWFKSYLGHRSWSAMSGMGALCRLKLCTRRMGSAVR